MNDILNVLKDYWQLILAALVFILSFILQLIKKKPINSIFQTLFEAVLYGISLSEREYPVGENGKYSFEKLETALDHAAEYLYIKYPDLDFDIYEAQCRLMIEAILSTPEKKGGKDDGEKKTHD